jgi:hypothetical protein
MADRKGTLQMRKKLIALSVALLTIGGSLTFIGSASAANNYAIVTDAAAGAAILLEGNTSPGIHIINSSQSIFGSVHSFDSINLGGSYKLDNSGIILNSSFGANNSDSVSDTRNFMHTILTDAGYSGSDALVTDLSSISFDFTTDSPDIKSVVMNFLFASGENIGSSYDIAIVSVDGVNYAYLPGGLILRVAPSSNLDSASGQLLGSSLSSIAPAQSLVALLDPALQTHHIAIAVADTADTVVATYLAVSSIVGSTRTDGGITPPTPTITLPPDFLTPKTYGNPASVTGTAPAAPAVAITPTAPVITARSTSVIYNGVPQTAAYSMDQKSSCSTTYNGSAIPPVTAGTYAVSLTCSANSLTSTATTTLTITKAAPVISWSTPSAITTATKLSSSQLNAFSYIPGSFTYSASAGSSLPVGDDLVTATFTPTDTTNYTSATMTVTIKVTA